MASVQPLFDAFWGGPDGMYVRRLGAVRAAPMNPFAAFAAAGVTLAFGSDAPVTPAEPWRALRAAVHHRTAGSGISARAALLAHTRGGHRAARRTGRGAGTIAVGAPAQFAVVSAGELVRPAADPAVQRWSTDPRSRVPLLPDLSPDAELPTTLCTVVDGRVVARRRPVRTLIRHRPTGRCLCMRARERCRSLYAERVASPTVGSEPVDASSAGPPASPPAGATARRRSPGTLPVRWGRALRGSGGLRILAALAGGLTMYAAFAPSTQWWAAIVGSALLGLALAGTNWRSGYGLGFLFGLAFYLPLLTWANIYVGDLPWIALATAEALLLGIAGALIAVVSRRLPVWPVFAAAAWVAGEALQARFPFGGFPWGSVAFSQPDGPLLPAARCSARPA